MFLKTFYDFLLYVSLDLFLSSQFFDAIVHGFLKIVFFWFL